MFNHDILHDGPSRGPILEVVLVPLTAGSFNVHVTSNTDLEVRKTIMDEGEKSGRHGRLYDLKW